MRVSTRAKLIPSFQSGLTWARTSVYNPLNVQPRFDPSKGYTYEKDVAEVETLLFKTASRP